MTTNNETTNTTNTTTPLDKKYSFWYRISDEALQFSKFQDAHLYENEVKKIHDIDTVKII